VKVLKQQVSHKSTADPLWPCSARPECSTFGRCMSHTSQALTPPPCKADETWLKNRIFLPTFSIFNCCFRLRNNVYMCSNQTSVLHIYVNSFLNTGKRAFSPIGRISRGGSNFKSPLPARASITSIGHPVL
jgi:hypothetical protein